MSDAELNAYQNTPQGTSAGIKVDLGTDNDVDLGSNNDVIIDVVSMGNGAVDEPIRFALFTDADAASNEAIAAVSSTKLRILSYTLNAAGGANTITFQSAAGALSGAMDIIDNGTIHASHPHGLFETIAGEAFNILMSAATLVAGHITYIEI